MDASMAPTEGDVQPPLRILFFPFLLPGHLIPMADMAALFAARGVRCTILTTPLQASTIRSIVDRANTSLGSVDVVVVPFPDVGLPPSAESGTCLTSKDYNNRFLRTAELLREPFRRFLSDHHAEIDAVVSDGIFHWSVDDAVGHGIPRITFLGTSMFARSCTEAMLCSNPFEACSDDPAAVVSLPGLPHPVVELRGQMMDPAKRPHEWALFQLIHAADRRSYGELFNSFHELEPAYAEHYRATLHRRAWLVGPVALASGSGKDVASRGAIAGALSPEAIGCLRWLDKKPASSVVYVSFGTMTSFSPEQTRELAHGLGLSGKNFLWVITNGSAAAASTDLCMPDGLSMAHRDRGYIVRGWAPQVLILNHPAVGGFMTHCGWNSTLEAVSAGVPMVTWPRYADQFHNEKLVVEVLGVGVSVGAEDYASCVETHQVVAGEMIAESIKKAMKKDGDGDTVWKKAEELGVMACKAVEKGGSSYEDVGQLMEELMARRT
ncbi:probable UDP-glucosyl transferase 73B6 [Aegilops tauschii subsp. strangulata]|uniref:Glycosyltransferase n=2 Tax=Aegilops tauschii TaxID=37682 RepID=A0A453A9C3_AEGTS|nr:UDP-glucose flavonoid 3-O-glucosyltransferase 7 [Aegilops tauschii subsp. strangulata]